MKRIIKWFAFILVMVCGSANAGFHFPLWIGGPYKEFYRLPLPMEYPQYNAALFNVLNGSPVMKDQMYVEHVVDKLTRHMTLTVNACDSRYIIRIGEDGEINGIVPLEDCGNTGLEIFKYAPFAKPKTIGRKEALVYLQFRRGMVLVDQTATFRPLYVPYIFINETQYEPYFNMYTLGRSLSCEQRVLTKGAEGHCGGRYGRIKDYVLKEIGMERKFVLDEKAQKIEIDRDWRPE